MVSGRADLARLRRVAVAALAQYPLAEGRLTFVSHGENTTFRHDGAEGSHLVRVHRPQRHGRAVDSTAAVLRWMDGRIHETSARPVHLRRLGEAMARLHDHADAWPPPAEFVRIRWDHEAFFGDVMVYGGIAAADCWELLPGQLRVRFREVDQRMADLIATADDVGLIHADLHLGNALFHRGVVKLIDFDDCGTGPRLYDLAVALWELRDRPDYPAFRDALLAGYRDRRDVDVGTWTTSSPCARSRSTCGTPAPLRSTARSPHASTGSTGGPSRCSTSCRPPDPARGRPFGLLPAVVPGLDTC